MAAGDLVQVGTPAEVGLGGITYANFIISGISGPQREADDSPIQDDRSAVVTHLFTNPRRVVTVSGVVKNTSHAELAVMEAMKPGDTVALNTGGTFAARTSENWMVQKAAKLERTGKETRCSFDLLREDSCVPT